MDFTWFKSAGLAAVQNFAHAILAVFGGNAVDVLHVNWVDTLSIGAGAALISVLTSIVSYKIAGQKTSTASGE
ncbi:holin [Mycobacterium heckeshornense]|uniref:holin n=1 Tax=Mycobacterium heckeshornense TaxID=110505 RepID=UPI0006628D42|nr:holin [Mycobacterium heckeshornense]KMV23327.1 hypothetical protein ACT16_06520 [Mycobacterium heckeshornense]